ncbi:methyl-accepting chemotaxis protein [Lysinibacillus antri]|uniref:methyl-accepting chemotaxis protein n=1 Tax=Lysinibacillus antri TaxID=2498145 RepID=UPI00131A074C|nr:HAMP domain-containing methyl-accepting chemotaxis protein [Lysinibacillus antri]
MERIQDNSKGLKPETTIFRVRVNILLKMIIIVILSLLISSLISAYINVQIKQIIDGSFSVYINTCISIIISTVVILLFVRVVILIPLNKVEEAIIKASEGDLTVSIQHDSTDEFGRLSTSFNSMISSLNKLLEKSNQTVLQVTESSDQLNTIAGENSKAIEQISDSIQEIASGAEGQAKYSSEIVKTVKEITKGINESASSVQVVTHIANSAKATCKSGNLLVNNTIQEMKEIYKATEDTSDIIQLLENKSKKIGEIVEIITQIAKQTNLLALNATIEAARAGEHGKGFAIVATEIRKLAEESASAGVNIRNIVEDTQLETNRAVESMNKGMVFVKNGSTLIRETGDNFKEILKDVEEVSQQSQEVSIMVEQINKRSRDMMLMIEEIASIIEQSLGNVQTVSASVEEQNASMEEMASFIAELNKIAHRLQIDIKDFKL